MQKLIRFSIYLIVLCFPLYIIRFLVLGISINLIELMVCLCFVFWILYIVFSSKIKNIDLLQKEKWLQYSIFLIFAGLTISTIFSENLRISAGIWKGWFIIPLMLLILIINTIKSEKYIKNIIIYLTISGIAVSLIALYYFLSRNLTYDGRLKAFYLSPNYLAMYLSPIFVLSLYLYSGFKKNIFKIILFISQFLLLFIIYLTQSYGALLGLCGALIFYIFLKNRIFKTMLAIILIMLIFCVLLSPSQKISSFKSRLVIWQSALEIIKNNPVVGIGPGMFQKYYLDYQFKFPHYMEWAVPQPHNIFLAFWLQTGIIGLIGFFLLLIVFFSSVIPAKLRIQHMQIILTVTMFYVLIHGLVDTTYWKNDLSMIFWIIIALNYTANHLFYLQK
ncbi:O-antigen ligase family protein [Patescibacteria group bacterium]